MTEDITRRISIQDLHARYTDAFYRKSEVDFRQCWASDAKWTLFGLSIEGRESIVHFWRELMQDRRNIWHAPQAIIVRTSDATAKGRVYFNETVTAPNGITRTALGIYNDEYKVENGEWCFGRRWLSLVYLGPSDFSGRYWDVPPMEAPPEFGGWESESKPTFDELRTYVKSLQ